MPYFIIGWLNASRKFNTNLYPCFISTFERKVSMKKNFTALFPISSFFFTILLFTLATTTVTLSAEKPQKPFKCRVSIPARLAPVYSFPSLTGSEYTAPPGPPKRNLRGAKAGEGIIATIGYTTFDNQHNCTMGRQVEHRRDFSNPFTPYGHYIHFGWTSQTGDTLGSGRGIGYQAYDIKDCGIIFDAGGIRIEANYAGYVGMDAHNIDAANSWGVPTAHENDDGTYHAKAYWDFPAGGPVFGVFTSDFSNPDFYGWYQNNGTGPGNENIWPKIDIDIDGAEFILHMVTTESGGANGDPQTFSYYRRVGPYGTGLGVWSYQRLIDTSMNINVTVASSPISDKVAIIWNSPVDYKRDTPSEFNSQYENDIWFAISNDNGASWENTSGPGAANVGPSIGNTVDLGIGGGYNANGGNLTLYDPMDDYKAYCDITALWYIDGVNDYLQIAWGCRRWIDTTSIYRRQGIIYHWNQSTDAIRTVVKADWDTGCTCYGHAWGSDAAKPTLSQCDGKLYTCYTQFGDRDNPCAYFDATNTVVSGMLYMSVYDPIYGAWDRAQKVTATTSPTGCIPGDMSGPGTCNSEYWSSMARYGRTDTCETSFPGEEVLDLIYINDYAPGGCVQTESGVWTVNPVNWVAYPCREAVPEPDYSDDAGPGYGLCVGQPIFVLGTTDDTTFVLMMENNGILPNTPVSIATAITVPGNGNTSVTCTPNSGISIAAAGGEVDVTVQMTTSGETNNVTVEGNITVTHQAGDTPPTDRVIPFSIIVSDDYVLPESAVITTPAKNLWIDNTGRMSGNHSNQSLDLTDDPDDCADIYLHDGSPIICVDRDQCYYSIYDNYYGSDHAFRPVVPLIVSSTASSEYTYAVCEFITADSAIGVTVEYFAPKSEVYSCFIIKRTTVWNRTEVTLTGVAVGEILDWDIPNYDSLHAASDNESGYDATRNLIYQYTCWNDECDTLSLANRAGGIASYKNEDPFKNYITIENDEYYINTTTTGSCGNDAVTVADSILYDLMTGIDGPSTAALDSCEDLSTIVTYGLYDLVPGETIETISILATSKNDPGYASLKQNVDLAGEYIENNDIFRKKAIWWFHLDWPLEFDYVVFGTIDCTPHGKPLAEGFGVACTYYCGFIPNWANDVIVYLRPSYSQEFDSHKHLASEWDETSGIWRLQNLVRWATENAFYPDSLPMVGNLDGDIDELHCIINLEEWQTNPRRHQDEYIIENGTCPQLPGYLFGTTPIIFDSLAGPDENPFSTTPLTDTLNLIGTSTLEVVEEELCDCGPGDANNDGSVNAGDAVYVIGYVFKGGPAPVPYATCSGDANGDCACNLGDAVYIISYVFKGGPPPVTCEEWVAACGTPIYK